MDIVLELKSIADVGLIGYPNVGKSTLLSVLTDAKPKIANYHFTTLQPNLGIIRAFGQEFIIADIPGLIEGAHAGVGLGYAFLRHVERTRLLVHVVDASGSEGRDPIEDYKKINEELAQYGQLADRPQIIAANKTDLPGAMENMERLSAFVGDAVKVFPVSAATNQGLSPLVAEIARVLPTLPAIESMEDAWESVMEREEANAFDIIVGDGAFVIGGNAARRLVQSVNFGDTESLNWFHNTLRRLGVIDRLREAGAKEGDTVVLSGMEFDFVE